MSRRASFAITFLLLVFPLFCFGEQPALVSTAVMSGLRGPVQSVLTEIFIYNDKGERALGPSTRTIYDRTGYETELFEFDSRGVLRRHTVYTRNGTHLVTMETTNPVSKQRSVQSFNSAGAITETDIYDSNGVLTAKTANGAPVNTEKRSFTTTRNTDGSISTVERFRGGSTKACTVKPDGIMVVHFHSRNGDWRQVTDSNDRSLEYIEEPSTGKYLRILSHYDKGGRESETVWYDRSGKLRGETTFQYPHEDKNGNWTEQQIWVKTNSTLAKRHQVTYRTITYYGNPLNGER